jgi:hypothetical protein
MGQKDKGLYGKFHIGVNQHTGRGIVIARNDLTDNVEGDKHFGCDYFLLDLTHDKHALAAIQAYAESCRKDGYELLADDLEEKVKNLGMLQVSENT